ncbi:MAG: hypothetical protein ACK4ZJ_16810, partial [Allorhizobium sp.]
PPHPLHPCVTACRVAVLSDLTAHPTLEYIQALEAERDHYREQSAQAARRVQTLSVALRAQERALSKCGPARTASAARPSRCSMFAGSGSSRA